MDNWIDLSNLPRRKDGKISWKDCNHNRVDFYYEGEFGYFFIDKRVCNKIVQVSYKNQSINITIGAIILLQLRTIKRMISVANYLDANPDKNCSSIKQDIYIPPENYKYDINQELILKPDVLVIKNKSVLFGEYKGYEVYWKTSGIQFSVTETALEKSYSWGRGAHYKIIPGINDLWTKRKDIAEMLLNVDDGYIYGPYSNVKVPFKCPQCGKIIGEKHISLASKNGISCNYCGDGVSYPNKLMAQLLSELKIDFWPEHVFDWCKFKNFNNDSITTGQYDFVVDSMNLIIEMDGGMGHGKGKHSSSQISLNEQIYRDKEKDRLAKENGYTLVRIDCDYTNRSKFEYCKNNIINKLSQYFDLSNIDWCKLNKDAVSSRMLKSIDMYNHSFSTVDIARIIKMDLSTIIDYLHKGTELGMCEFIPYTS